jgi:hypothetical protein
MGSAARGVPEGYTAGLPAGGGAPSTFCGFNISQRNFRCHLFRHVIRFCIKNQALSLTAPPPFRCHLFVHILSMLCLINNRGEVFNLVCNCHFLFEVNWGLPLLKLPFREGFKSLIPSISASHPNPAAPTPPSKLCSRSIAEHLFCLAREANPSSGANPTQDHSLSLFTVPGNESTALL